MREIMEQPISSSEIDQAIKTMAGNKAPGPDGIVGAFYKKFREKLSEILVRVFADIHTRGLLPPSMRHSTTVLVPKREKREVPVVDDFRPISLLSTEYKILARVLARRMEIGMRRVIGEHQVYGMKGRKIATHLHHMRVICETTSSAKVRAAVFHLDLSRAFDRVSHAFLFKLIQWCDPGAYMSKWLRICYREIATCVIINGKKTCAIPVARSVRQGCPLSPVLFAIYLEPLCRAIISNQEIHGIELATGEVKLLAYADDVAAVVSSKEQLQEVAKEIQRFCTATGALLNWKKSVGSWLGPWENAPPNFMGASWTTSVKRYLGVDFSQDSTVSCRWTARLQQLHRALEPWNGRNVSILNRAYVCNTSLYPAVIYHAQATQCDGLTTNRIHRIFATFIWRSPMEKMRRINLFHPLDRGGFQLVNVAVKLIVHRFLLFRSRNSPVIRAALQTVGAGYLAKWIVTTAAPPAKKSLLKFYKEVADSVAFFSGRFSWDYLTTANRKKLYWDTISCLFPPPLYRQAFVNKEVSDVLPRVKKLPIATWIKDCFVRFHTETLPVKMWMKRKGFDMPGTWSCRSCYQDDESLQHTFYDCRNAIQFWAAVGNLVGTKEVLEWTAIKFLDFAQEPGRLPLEICVAIGVHALWTYRADVEDCKKEPRIPWTTFVSGLLWTASALESRGELEGSAWAAVQDLEKP